MLQKSTNTNICNSICGEKADECGRDYVRALTL